MRLSGFTNLDAADISLSIWSSEQLLLQIATTRSSLISLMTMPADVPQMFGADRPCPAFSALVAVRLHSTIGAVSAEVTFALSRRTAVPEPLPLLLQKCPRETAADPGHGVADEPHRIRTTRLAGRASGAMGHEMRQMPAKLREAASRPAEARAARI